jgi:hypothetical protein
MTSHAAEERDVHTALTYFGGASCGVRAGVGDFCEVLCTLNREGYDLNHAQLQAIIERCVASGTVTRHFDSEGAGMPLLMAIISWGEENTTPNKRPMIDEADSAFESDKSLSRCTTPPQTKKKRLQRKQSKRVLRW